MHVTLQQNCKCFTERYIHSYVIQQHCFNYRRYTEYRSDHKLCECNKIWKMTVAYSRVLP